MKEKLTVKSDFKRSVYTQAFQSWKRHGSQAAEEGPCTTETSDRLALNKQCTEEKSLTFLLKYLHTYPMEMRWIESRKMNKRGWGCLQCHLQAMVQAEESQQFLNELWYRHVFPRWKSPLLMDFFSHYRTVAKVKFLWYGFQQNFANTTMHGFLCWIC